MNEPCTQEPDQLNDPVRLQDGSSFKNMLDTACIGLQKKSALFRLQKLDELDMKLKSIEKELAGFAAMVNGQES
jgi:hypothetical protein